MTFKKLLLGALAAGLLTGCQNPTTPEAPTFAPSAPPAATVSAALSPTPPPTITVERASSGPAAATATRSAPPSESSVTPNPAWDWPTAAPADQGMDPALLADLLADAPQQAPSLHSLLVIRDGAIVSEMYYHGNTASDLHAVYSVTKSVNSALIGIAIQQGFIQSVDQRVVDFFPNRTFDNMDDRKAGMTLKDVLTMTTGLQWIDGDPYWAQIRSSADWLDYMLGLTMAANPGERFNYCSGCSHILSEILYATTGQTPQEYADQYLFGPLGIRGETWEADPQGISIGGWGLALTSHQMARLGQLYLDQGRWQGQQVVPANWVAESTRALMPGDRLGLSYGYQWWYNPALQGFAAIGVDGQLIFVQPSTRLVVVFTSGSTDHAVEFDLIGRYILPAVQQQ